MNSEQADSLGHVASAYVHIPFCSAVCPYCDFAVVAGQDDLIGRYVEAVCAEIIRSDPWRSLDSVYFGGGTPGRVPSEHLDRILEALQLRHGIASDAELSLECNPEDFDASIAEGLRGVGFNRISFGAQSFDDDVLRSLGRRHVAADIEVSFGAAREAGFENVSLDLIFGAPAETDRSWARTLHSTTALEPEHVSCYALTVERGTELSRAVRDGAPGPDPDAQADRYGQAESHLVAFGLQRYEVSNWARPGRECRYNLGVWAQGEFEAYGNGAHGFRDGRRFRNHRRLDAYIECIEAGKSPRSGQEILTGWDFELDRLFVGLRRTVGAVAGPGGDSLCASPEGRNLIASGVISRDRGRLRVVNPLMTDAVSRSVLALKAPNVMGDGDA